MYKEVSFALLGLLLLTTTIQSQNPFFGWGPQRFFNPGGGFDRFSSFENPMIRNPMIRNPVNRNPVNRNPIIQNPVNPSPNINSQQPQGQSGGDLEQFRQQMLQSHNQYRAQHCAKPLTLDSRLNAEAQQYAEHLVSIDRLEHARLSGVGENLYGGSSFGPVSTGSLGKAASDMWYNEVSAYDFNRPGFSSQTGHFTQLVWKNTAQLGAGVAFNSDRTKYYVVARYSPAGNFGNQYQQNVLPRSSSC